MAARRTPAAKTNGRKTLKPRSSGSKNASKPRRTGTASASKPRRAGTASASKPRRAGSKKKVSLIKVGPIAVGVIIAILLAIIVFPHIRRYANDSGACVPEGSFSYVLDISHHQKHVVWDSLKVATDARGRTVRDLTKATRIRRLDYVVIKATEGENWKDDRFQEYWKAAADAGLRRGAYHFFLPSKDPVAQARNFISSVPNLRYKDMAPVLDVEVKPSGWSKERFNTAVLNCLKELETYYERKPIIYAPDSFIKDIFSHELLAYPIWVAHYETESPVAENWRYWQFTDKAVVYGIDGKVDLSIIK